MNVSSININGEQQYPVSSVASMIEEYIFRLKGARIKIRLIQGHQGMELFPEDVDLFTKAAEYAIPAFEGGFKLKKDEFYK